MTPHNEANINDIASTVLMPGDPLRAKYIATKFLENAKLVNQVRGMYAYTGTYKNKEVTVMASGMGMPSIGIYSYELYKFYNVENIIRIGSAGSYSNDLHIYDVVLATSAYSESSYALTQNNCKENILYPSSELNNVIKDTANSLNMTINETAIHSSDVFYKNDNNYQELVNKYNVKAVEMESFALFHNANVLGKKAACLLTISDSLVTDENTTSEQREKTFDNMILLALESVNKL